MMKSKQSPAPLAWLLALMLLIMPLAFLLLPRQPYSALEKRALASPPRLSLQSGLLSQQTEGWLGDHYPLRSAWVGLDAWRRMLSGSMAADEIWRLKDGALVEKPLPDHWARLERNLALLGDFAARSGQPLQLLIVPAAGAISKEPGYYPYPDGQILRTLVAPAGVLLPALFEPMRAAEGPLYYRTDPHWNAQGAYLAYQQVAAALDMQPLTPDAFVRRQSPGFLGTCYARSSLWSTPPDALDLWAPPVRLRLQFDGDEASYDSLFFEEHLLAPDQYPVFLDGNHGLTRIDNLDNPQGPRLLLIKDSFGNSLAPLLLPHFGHITVIDLRAWRGSTLQLAADQPFDHHLAVYSLKSLATDSNLAWLNRE